MNYNHPLQIEEMQSSNSHKPAARIRQHVLVILLLCIGLGAVAQKDNRLVLADKYFANGDYFTAAQLYEQFLNPLDKKKVEGGLPINSKRTMKGGTGPAISRLDVLYKQAESYRLSYYMLEASARYQECYEKDPAKYADALYWHAVCQRSLARYDVAITDLEKFIKEHSSSSLKPAAEKELETLRYVKQQLVRPDTVFYVISKVNTSFGNEKGVFAPVPAGNNQLIVTSTEADSTVKAGVNPYHNRLFNAKWMGGTITSIEPVNFTGLDKSLNQGTATFSPDGSIIYFTQWKKEKGVSSSAIYSAKREGNGWSQPQLVSSLNVEGYNSKQPFVTGDGKYVLFSSDRPGGSGKFDIWYAPLNSDGSVGTAVNAGAAVNTDADEQAPYYHGAAQTLVFSSNGRVGMGGFDLFTSKGWGAGFEPAQNMGYPVNSSRDDVYYTADASGLYKNALMSSDRGSNCCLETFTLEKLPKYRRITGQVTGCEGKEAVSGAEVTLKDAEGKTWQTTTDANGTYAFEFKGSEQPSLLTVTQSQYKDKSANVNITNRNETDVMTDVLTNEAICLDKKLVIRPEDVVTIYFDFDKSKLKSRSKEVLDSIVVVLTENPNATIQISGYTDGMGSEDYNVALGERRAKACADYLMKNGINKERISFESFGECCPVEMELINGRDNPDGRSKNRRALINIKK